MIPKEEKFGWIPDKEDKRDFKYSDIQVTVPTTPPEASVQTLFPLPYIQGNLGSCVGQATKALMAATYIKQQLADPILSALMIYFSARELADNIPVDVGCSPRNALKSAAKTGVCTELLWPYIIEKFADRPTPECYTDALNHQVLSYYSIEPTLTMIRSCIAEGYPLSAGILVYENFPMETTTGEIPLPRGEFKGGHDIVVVGYNDSKRQVTFRNSWGMWGDSGYGYLPYEYVTPELMGDLWTIRMVGANLGTSPEKDSWFVTILKIILDLITKKGETQ